MKTVDRLYEEAWARDFSLSSHASEIARQRMKDGEPAYIVIREISQRIKPKFVAEDRSYWCPAIRSFVDLTTLVDQAEVAALAMVSKRKR